MKISLIVWVYAFHHILCERARRSDRFYMQGGSEVVSSGHSFKAFDETIDKLGSVARWKRYEPMNMRRIPVWVFMYMSVPKSPKSGCPSGTLVSPRAGHLRPKLPEEGRRLGVFDPENAKVESDVRVERLAAFRGETNRVEQRLGRPPREASRTGFCIY